MMNDSCAGCTAVLSSFRFGDVQGKNDVLFVPKLALAQPMEFAFIGLEAKKNLTLANVDQALAEYLTWALHSNSAFVQVQHFLELLFLLADL
jgi:hypothetical protein